MFIVIGFYWGFDEILGGDMGYLCEFGYYSDGGFFEVFCEVIVFCLLFEVGS